MSIEETIASMSQQILRAQQPMGPYERADIEKAVDKIIGILGESAVSANRKAAVQAVETAVAITVGHSAKLVDDTDHIAWYVGARKAERPFFARYADYLRQVLRWPEASVRAVDDATDDVLELLEDPCREGSWDRRGLVVGHVQSGKTANYTGLVCKAADAGYRLIVVLAGMHKALRKQTQERLDRDFLGYDSRSLGSGEGLKFIGVSSISQAPIAEFLTTQDVNGDFNREAAMKAGMSPHRPLLLVIKKNASILANLNSWVEDLLVGRGDTRKLPLLVIDDEADQASVDTREQSFDEEGTADPDHEPTRINGQIRRLLRAFEKKAYVAYTATPFANILIHDERKADAYGADLFPRSFIVGLPAPSNYVGPAAVFGIESEDTDDDLIPLVRRVDQVGESWVPVDHDRDLVPLYRTAAVIPPSLEDAILSFILSCAAKRARGLRNAHNSMLVHVTRYKDVQSEVLAQVDSWFTRIARQIRFGTGSAALFARLESIWRDDFEPTSNRIAETPHGRHLVRLEWNQVRDELVAAVERIKVQLVNSDIKEPLDYESYKETGLNVIAVGGDKLSRGLTLEGLSTSYFLRASRMYDTLMQMGRWFGYRDGYVDLCRTFLPDDLALWFRHVATAAEELRGQLAHMWAIGATPKQYGLKVQSHDILLVTAQNKMRDTAEYQVSFAGDAKIQTVFFSDADNIRANAEKCGSFLASLGTPRTASAGRGRKAGSEAEPEAGAREWGDVPGTAVSAFLRGLRTPEESCDVNGPRLADYVDRQVRAGELTNWTVALRAGGEDVLALASVRVATIRRKRLPIGKRARADRYVVKTILSPHDEAIDLSPEQYQHALDLTNERRRKEGIGPAKIPAGPEIRHVRGLGSKDGRVAGDPRKGLLLIYPLSPRVAEVEGALPVVGIVVSFPKSPTAQPVTYRYNQVLRRLEAL